MSRAVWSSIVLCALAPVVGALVAAGCASGGSSNSSDDSGDDVPKVDAPHGTPIDSPHSVPLDSPPPIDAPHSIDAFVFHDAPLPPDAGGMSGGFCSDNTQCIAGECCFTVGGGVGLCVPGTVVFGVCFPDS